MKWEILVNTAQARNEMIFERANGSFGGVATMDARRDQLVIDGFAGHEGFKSFGAFIIETLEFGSEAGSDQAGVHCLVGGENAFAGATAHGCCQDAVAVVVVEDE